MKITREGEINKNASTLSDSEIDDILKLTHEKIMDAMSNILEGNFIINPKILNSRNVSCEYCKYKDICYHTDKDNKILKDDEEE